MREGVLQKVATDRRTDKNKINREFCFAIKLPNKKESTGCLTPFA